MSVRFGAIAALAVAVAVEGLAATPANAAPPASKGGAKAACLAAHEEATSLLTQKKPHAAHDKFVTCARAECPTVVRKECGEQLAIAEKDAPTVALEAHDESGADTTAVKVTVDGRSLADRLTGSAVDVEPGEHVFRFERADGKSIEQRVLVVEGEKNRKVVADFATLVPKPPLATGDVAPVAPQDPKKIPAVAYVVGAVGVVALGGFGFFALTGKGAEKELASSCNPNCSNDQLSPVKRDYLFADISLAVGVVALVTAVILAWPALTDGAPSSTTASITRHRAPPPWMPRIKTRALP